MWTGALAFGPRSSYADCSSILKDSRLSAKRTGALLVGLPAERQAEFAELTRMLGLWMLFIEAPEHSRLRKLMNKGFSAAVAESLRPQIEAIVDRMLEPLRHASEAELMHEVALTEFFRGALADRRWTKCSDLLSLLLM